MVHWDADRYEQLQDSAWELELLASEQSTNDDANAGWRDRETKRTTASDLRKQAADLLAQYWVPHARPR